MAGSSLTHDLKLAPELIADALEHGHSLKWRDQFFETVRAGTEDAEAGRFATPDDFERVLNKYRPS